MSLNRYAAKRDGNEKPLIKAARDCGALLYPIDEPADWIMLWRRQWHVVEVKERKGKLTDNQKTFHLNVQAAGGEILVWRTVEDVLKDLNRLTQQVHQG